MPERRTDLRLNRLGRSVVVGSLAVGLISFGTGTLVGGVIALWAFAIAAVALALVLPFPLAVVSPLYMGLLGWLVDMLPLVILIGWAAVTLRWLAGIWSERRMPRGGRWVWLPVGILVWTGAGVLTISTLDFKHFLLLLGIQFVITGVILAIVDRMRTQEERTATVTALMVFVIVMSVGVLLQWAGVPLESLQDTETRRRVEAAYGVDAFPNAVGMVKYARSVKPGVEDLRADLVALGNAMPQLPEFEVFRPKFQAYENSLVVRFEGSARDFQDELAPLDVSLIFDNVGLAPANTVPRLRSFPRNALTYAGVCAALLPFGFFLAWTSSGRRRLLGWAGVAACLFGAAFSLARGAWVVIVLGGIYLAIDGVVNKRLKLQYAAAVLITAAVATTFFLIRYEVDPLTGRAGGGASVSTREETYADTLAALKNPKYALFGYGTEQPRTESGTVREGPGQRYVPRAGTHSTYLNYLFRTGIPGALMVLGLYLIAGLHARAAARERAGEERIFFVAAATSMIIVGAHAVILSLYVEPTYTLSVSIVLGFAASAVSGLSGSILPWRRGRVA